MVNNDENTPSNNATSVKKTITFNSTLSETHLPTTTYKRLFRRLRTTFNVNVNKDEITSESLAGIHVLIFGNPTRCLNGKEVEVLKGFVDGGGGVLCLMGEGKF